MLTVRRLLRRSNDLVCNHPLNQPLYARNITSPWEIHNSLFHRKATLVCHLLERRVGASHFKKCIHSLLNGRRDEKSNGKDGKRDEKKDEGCVKSFREAEMSPF